MLAALDLVAYPVALLTVTPPGDAALSPSEENYRRWNRSAAIQWKRLDRRVKGRLRRQGLTLRPLARVAQRQRRGLDHLHLVIALETADDWQALRAYVGHLKALAPEYGFGFVDDPTRRRRPKPGAPARDMVFESAAIAGRYLCRYLAESDQLAAMLHAGDHSFRPLWIASELTQASGVNCRRLRRVRHAWFVCRALDAGSRPTLPVWWGDALERRRVIRLVRSPTLAAYY